MAPVIGVVGGSGGVGSSTFATVLAGVAGRATLIDLDPVGGGIDVLLAIEDAPGARWSGLRLSGGYLDPAALAHGLPRWREVAVLAADVAPDSPDSVEQVIAAAADSGVVVLDLPRAPSEIRDLALERCDLCLLVVAADVRPLVSAVAVLRTLGETPVGVVLRRGGMSTAEALPLLDAQLVGVLPRREPARAKRGPRPARVAERVARGVLRGLAGRDAARSSDSGMNGSAA